MMSLTRDGSFGAVWLSVHCGGELVAKARDSIKIVNVVASGSVGRELDLLRLTSQLDGAEYDPKKFPGLVYRANNPKTASLLFRSGRIVCTGAQSIDDARKGIEHVIQSLRNVGIEINDTQEIEVQNIVASADLHAALNLNAVAMGLGLEHTEYEPEQFPGLVYRVATPKVVALLFASGKMIITGGRKLEDPADAADRIAADLKSLGLLQ